MAIKVIDDSTLTAIANSIRAKGVDGTFTPAQMSQAIDNIPAGGGGGNESEVTLCLSRTTQTYYVEVPGATRIAFDYEVIHPSTQTKPVLDDYRSLYGSTNGPVYQAVNNKGVVNGFTNTGMSQILVLNSPPNGATGTVEFNAPQGHMWIYHSCAMADMTSGWIDLRLKNFRAV